MGTYDHKKLLSDWATGRITNDMATGHTLQHLDLLYQAQEQANQQRLSDRQAYRDLKDKVSDLTKENKRLRRQVDKLQQQVDNVSGLNLTLYQLKDEVDSLKHRLAKDSPA